MIFKGYHCKGRYFQALDRRFHASKCSSKASLHIQLKGWVFLRSPICLAKIAFLFEVAIKMMLISNSNQSKIAGREANLRAASTLGQPGQLPLRESQKPGWRMPFRGSHPKDARQGFIPENKEEVSQAPCSLG
jgi:hypothetical protein